MSSEDISNLIGHDAGQFRTIQDCSETVDGIGDILNLLVGWLLEGAK